MPISVSMSDSHCLLQAAPSPGFSLLCDLQQVTLLLLPHSVYLWCYFPLLQIRRAAHSLTQPSSRSDWCPQLCSHRINLGTGPAGRTHPPSSRKPQECGRNVSWGWLTRVHLTRGKRADGFIFRKAPQGLGHPRILGFSSLLTIL